MKSVMMANANEIKVELQAIHSGISKTSAKWRVMFWNGVSFCILFTIIFFLCKN